MNIFIGILPSLVQLSGYKPNLAHETKMSRADTPGLLKTSGYNLQFIKNKLYFDQNVSISHDIFSFEILLSLFGYVLLCV